MNELVSPIAATSYTNRDFVSIYNELLELTKQLTEKWDPSISNESDPGVILLKLNAIIADKCNYAIDKSVLECFPLSVTQETNARQLFEQLGYYMHWYKAATTDVNIKWIGETRDLEIDVPAFTMVTDKNSNIVYSLLGPVEGGIYNIASQKLPCNKSKSITFKAIQGIAVDYQINNSKLIMPSNLDSNRRLYFDTTSVAENGIFITNVGENNYSMWVKKDNLAVESIGNTFYKFGVRQDGTACYIEFPEDAEAIFKDGINITYIQTDGAAGVVTDGFLSKFYNYNTVMIESLKEVINLDSSNIAISNGSSSSLGEDTETINEAYRGYKRVSGTFDTLVTLRDYINYINSSGLISNGFVCDRNNDIQTCYKVSSLINDVEQPIIKRTPSNTLGAADLKFYLFNYVPVIDNALDYNKSFYMLDNVEINSTIKNYMSDVKCLNHNIQSILEPDATHANICCIKNKYPVSCTLIYQSNLTVAQQREVVDNIIRNLYNKLNSKTIDFSEKLEYDLLYKYIMESDTRIKNVSLDNIEYTTFVVCRNASRKLTYTDVDGELKWLNNEWVEENPATYNLFPAHPVEGAILELPVTYDEIELNGSDYYFCSNNKKLDVEFDTTIYQTKLGIDKCYADTLFECIDVSDHYCWMLNGLEVELSDYGIQLGDVEPSLGTSIVIEYKTDYSDILITSTSGTPTIDEDKFKEKMGTTGSVLTFVYSKQLSVATWVVDDEVVDPASYGVKLILAPNAAIHVGDKFRTRLSYSHQARNEIFVKSVLAGVTPYFISDDTFNYKLTNRHNYTLENIEKLYTNVDIQFDSNTYQGILNQTYKLRENEAIQFYSPNLIDKSTYSNYTKFEYHVSTIVAQDSCYQLGANEYIIFYWKENEDELYRYHCYGSGTIICPTFPLDANPLVLNDDTVAARYGLLIKNNTDYQETSSDVAGSMTLTCSRAVGNIVDTTQLLSGSKKFIVKELNQFRLNENYNVGSDGTASRYGGIYWFLNDASSDGAHYTLFTDGEATRLLTTGEYFIVANETLSSYTAFGAGTELTRNTIVGDWRVKASDKTLFTLQGLKAIDRADYFTLPEGAEVQVTENSFVTVGTDATVKVNLPNKQLDTVYVDATLVSESKLEFERFEIEEWVESQTSSTVAALWGRGKNIFKFFDATEELESGWYYCDSSSGVSIPVMKIENPEVVGMHWVGTASAGDLFTIVQSCDYSLIFNHDGILIDLPELTDLEQPVTLPAVYRLSNVFVDDFTFSYKIDDTSPYVDLDSVILQTHVGYNGRSLLGIRLASDSEQVLLSRQSIFYKLINEPEFIEIQGADKTFNEPEDSNVYPVCLLSSFSIADDGGSILNTTIARVDDLGNVVVDYLKLYNFTKVLSLPENTAAEFKNYIVTKEGVVNFMFTPTVTDISYKLKLPVGKYILPVKVLESNLHDCYITFDDIKLTEMHDFVTTDVSEQGVHYMYMPIEEEVEHILTMHVEGHTIDCSVQVGNCYKYTESSVFGNPEFVQQWLSYFDVDKEYNYTLNIFESKKIENPLLPVSFFNINHIYNDFTITQLLGFNIK